LARLGGKKLPQNYEFVKIIFRWDRPEFSRIPPRCARQAESEKTSKSPLDLFRANVYCPALTCDVQVKQTNRPGSSGSPLPPWDPLLPGVFFAPQEMTNDECPKNGEDRSPKRPAANFVIRISLDIRH
jgi:hypothetical protein